MPTTPVLWKDLTQVNTTDNGAQQVYGQVTPLANGGYVVVWADTSNFHNPSGYAMVGQVYNALGDKVGGEVLLSASAHAHQPEVITLTNGNIAVAFADLGAGNGDVLVRVFDPTLALVRTDTIASSALHEFNPSLTALGGGGYAVTYTAVWGVTDYDVIARSITADGVLGTPFEIASWADFGTVYLPDKQDQSEVAQLSDGNIVAVFRDGDGTLRFGIAPPQGGGEPPFARPPTLAARPDVAALAGGGFVLVWTDTDLSGGTDIEFGIFTNEGNYGSGGGTVNSIRPGVQNDATVTALADGGFLVAWEDDTRGFVRGQRFNASGAEVGDEFVLSNSVTHNSAETSIRLALLADGRVALVANTFDGADYDVVTSIWDPRDGGAVGGTDNSETLTGTAGGSSISGLGGDDVLMGFDGPDTLDGGVGADMMQGGGGDDTYLVDNGGDQVIEAPGQGTDTVLAAVSFALTVNVENLTLTGGADISGTGNDLANVLIGNAGANLLNGLGGPDTMQGLAGDDTYMVDDPGDVVDETAAGSDGIDTVLAAISFTLSANVENLTLIGGGAINGSGNELNNILTGNAASNVLTGGLGVDSFVFIAALNKTTNVDTLTDFSVADDTILLDNAIFAKLKKDGELKKKYFEVGKKADDKDDFIVHNKKTGELFYDADGSKKKIDAIAFADLAEGLKLKADDFFVV